HPARPCGRHGGHRDGRRRPGFALGRGRSRHHDRPGRAQFPWHAFLEWGGIMSSPQIITFGCRLNTYESALMERHVQDAGLQDTLVFNTCAVTAEATRQARQAIRKARRENPNARIIVTGCAAQTEPETFAAMAEVNHVIGNMEKLDRAAYGDFGAGLAE